MIARFLLSILLAAASSPAFAHKASDAYLDLSVDGAAVAVRWDIALRDLDVLVELDRDGDDAITWAEVDARRQAIVATALAAIDLSAAGRRCTPGPVDLQLARRGDGAYAVLRFAADCGRPAAAVDVDYRLLERIDPTHRAIVSVAGAGAGDDAAARLTMLRPGDPPPPIALQASAGTAQGHGFGVFVAEGIRHILGGIDHLAFLIALLVPAVAIAGATGRRLGDTLIELLAIVTLFTVAHSITLAMTALEWISLPSRLVESVIAASVILAGVHAYRVGRRWMPAPRSAAAAASPAPAWAAAARAPGESATLLSASAAASSSPSTSASGSSMWIASRTGSAGPAAAAAADPTAAAARTSAGGMLAPWLVFAFGLVHGFGFGSALTEVGFGGRSAIPALLGFNLGVEIGQLLVLSLVFPVAWLLRRTPAYRKVLLPAAAALIVLAGAGWFVERAFDLELFAGL